MLFCAFFKHIYECGVVSCAKPLTTYCVCTDVWCWLLLFSFFSFFFIFSTPCPHHKCIHRTTTTTVSLLEPNFSRGKTKNRAIYALERHTNVILISVVYRYKFIQHTCVYTRARTHTDECVASVCVYGKSEKGVHYLHTTKTSTCS